LSGGGSLAGGGVDIEGQLIARSGSINVEATALYSNAHAVDSVTGKPLLVKGDAPGSASTSYVPTTPNPPGLFTVVLGSKAAIDTSGLWVNDSGADATNLFGPAFVNAGSVTLQTDARTALCVTVACNSLPGLGQGIPNVADPSGAYVDLTGNIVLSRG